MRYHRTLDEAKAWTDVHPTEKAYTNANQDIVTSTDDLCVRWSWVRVPDMMLVAGITRRTSTK